MEKDEIAGFTFWPDQHPWKTTTTTTTTTNDGGGFSGSDEDLAKEMNQLSVQEREKIFEEIHLGTELQETPESIQAALERLDNALSGINPRRRKSLDKAIFQNPTLLKNGDGDNQTIHNKFKLMFLRAEQYDAERAAKRIVGYFDSKRRIFGEDKLAKTITQDDLSEEDKKIFELGSVLVLPGADASGRPMLFINACDVDSASVSSLIKCIWYVNMVALENEATQIKGLCVVDYLYRELWSLPALLSKGINVIKRITDDVQVLPIRCTSYHFCYSDAHLAPVLSAMRIALGKDVRLRLKTHVGSPLEIKYSLMAFGVKIDEIFEGRHEQKKLQEQFFQRRRQVEDVEKERRVREEASMGIAFYPNPRDVLIGRGLHYREHVGNTFVSQLVSARLDSYHNNDRFGKTCVSMDVVQCIRDHGGRFLQRTEGGWKVLQDKVAREKMASMFRTKALSQTTAK